MLIIIARYILIDSNPASVVGLKTCWMVNITRDYLTGCFNRALRHGYAHDMPGLMSDDYDAFFLVL